MSDTPAGSPPGERLPAGAPSGGRLRSALSHYGYVFMYWLIFVGILGGMAYANEKYPALVEVHFSRWTAQGTGWIMRLLGMGGAVHGIEIVNPYCRFIIIGECTAYYPMGIFVAAVMAYPCRIIQKLVGFAWGLPVILLFNLLRLVTLCYVFRMYPTFFDAVHILVWQSLMIFFTILIWVLWVATLGHGDASQPS